MVVRCPNCGSTAQVRLARIMRSGKHNERIEEYNCGCGCHFKATYTLARIEITKNPQIKRGA